MPSSDELRRLRAPHPAALAFAPLVDLSSSPYASLSARAVTHWLVQPDHRSWGASMYLHGSTRQWLRRGGLAAPLDADSVDTNEPRWLEQRAAIAAGTADAAVTLHHVRLLLYLGFYDDATRVLADWAPTDGADAIWATHLGRVAGHLRDPGQRTRPEPVRAEPSTSEEVRPAFLLTLRDAVESIRWAETPEEGAALLARADDLAGAMTGVDRRLAHARVSRHRATLAQRRGDADAAIRAVDETIERYDSDPDLRAALASGPDGFDFLLREGARRAATFGALCAIDARRRADARRLADLAVRLDPWCGSATLLAAELAADAGDVRAAAELHRRTAQISVVERATGLVGELETTAGPVDEAAAVAAATEDWRTDAELRRRAARLVRVAGSATAAVDVPDDRTAFDLPLTVASMRQLPPSDTSHRRAIEWSDTFQRFPAFWTLEDRTDDAELPYWARQPANAHGAWRDGRVPYFEAVYFQSTAGTGIRESLLWAALGTQRLSATEVFGETLDSLSDASETAGTYVEAVRRAGPKTSPLELAQLARTAGYLGFLDDAQALVGLADLPRRLDPASAFAAYTDLFLRYLAGADDAYLRDAIDVFERCEPCDETLRTRLVLCIQAGGWCGKQDDADAAATWRHRGLELLDELERCDRLDDDETGLLRSRFWRFACFVPFLTGDVDALLREAAHYEELARRHSCGGRYARENLYAALETKARICQHLGDHPGAVAAFEELVGSVDPLDAKAWLNLGDALERAGDRGRATEAFRRAARLGPPYREIAWYRAGTGAEAAGDLEEALRCHLRSLWSAPLGFSPLEAIARLAAAVGDRHLRDWAVAALERATDGSRPIHPGLTTSIRDAVQGVPA